MEFVAEDDSFSIKEELCLEKEYFEIDNKGDVQMDSPNNNGFKCQELFDIFAKRDIITSDENITIFKKDLDDDCKNELLIPEKNFLCKQISVSDVNQKMDKCLHSQLNMAERLESSDVHNDEECLIQLQEPNVSSLETLMMTENCVSARKLSYVASNEKSCLTIQRDFSNAVELTNISNCNIVFPPNIGQAAQPLSHFVSMKENESLIQSEEISTVSYEIVEKCTSNGKSYLIDSRGYSYTLEATTSNGTSWRCVKRNSKVYCNARVKQREENFQLGLATHCHPPNSGALLRAKVLAEIKREALLKPSLKATAIVNEVLKKYFKSKSGSEVFNPLFLARIINNFRQKTRLKNPSSSDYLGYQEDNSLTQPENLLLDQVVKYEKFENVTPMGKSRLIDNRGYSYAAMITKAKGTTYWKCSLHNKKFSCRAKVRQRGENFQIGRLLHSHPPNKGALLTAEVLGKVKRDAVSDPSVSAIVIAERALEKYIEAKSYSEILNSKNLERIVNNLRQKNSVGCDPSYEFPNPHLLFNTHNGNIASLQISCSGNELKCKDDDSRTQREGLSHNSVPLAITFEIVEKATPKGKSYLIDSRGYTYTFETTTSKGTSWRCAKRNSNVYCNARVKQREENFQLGLATHCHPPNSKALLRGKFISELKNEALLKPSMAAAAVVEKVMKKYSEAKSCSQFSDTTKHVRMIDRIRQKTNTGNSNSKELKGKHSESIAGFNDTRTFLRDSMVTLSDCLPQSNSIPITFEKFENVTACGMPCLFDSRGYSYTLTSVTSKSTTWRCQVRNKIIYCRARVRQQGNDFKLRLCEHSHPPNSEAILTSKVLVEIRKEALLKPSVSAPALAENALKKYFEGKSYSGILNPQNLARSINRYRQKNRLMESEACDVRMKKRPKQDTNVGESKLKIIPTNETDLKSLDLGNVIEPIAHSFGTKECLQVELKGHSNELSRCSIINAVETSNEGLNGDQNSLSLL